MTVEPLHTPTEAAQILGISLKTLMEHVENGRIRSIVTGGGKRRVHRKFTDKNITTFIQSQKVRETPPCQSISQKATKPLTTSMSFGSTVIDFAAVPKPPAKKMLKP